MNLQSNLQINLQINLKINPTKPPNKPPKEVVSPTDHLTNPPNHHQPKPTQTNHSSLTYDTRIGPGRDGARWLVLGLGLVGVLLGWSGLGSQYRTESFRDLRSDSVGEGW